MVSKVAVVQDCPVIFDCRATIDKVGKISKEAAANGAKLLVFPEAFVSAYPKGLDFGAKIGLRTNQGREIFSLYYNSSLELNGKEFKELLSIAKINKVYISIGVIEKDRGTLYCTVLFISPAGDLIGKHRKIMPTAMERVVWGFGDGSTLPVIETPIGRMGAVICWENYMPMMRMAMYSQGIQIYCSPTADDRETWISTIKHIAIEGRCYVLSACQYIHKEDCPKAYDYYFSQNKNNILMTGGSSIVSPFGDIISGPYRNEKKILYADIDLKEIIKGKYDFDVVGHYSRPDIFELSVNKSPLSPVKTFSKNN